MNKENKKQILSERIENFCQKAFPARQILLKSNDKTVFFNLKSSTQTAIACGMFCLIAWSIFSIAVITMDSLGAGNFREQAIRDQENYQLRLMSLAEERDYQQDSSRQTQIKFEKALAPFSKFFFQSIFAFSSALSEIYLKHLNSIFSSLHTFAIA